MRTIKIILQLEPYSFSRLTANPSGARLSLGTADGQGTTALAQTTLQ
jgi:hypothetical protein